MKKFMLIPALALAIAAPVWAQVLTNPTTNNSQISEYVVHRGDNLWKLADLRLHNPEQWRWLVKQNQFLNDPGRQFTKIDGTFVVVIKEGEVLHGLQEVGITPNTVANPITPPYHYGQTQVVDKTFTEKVGDWLGSNWWWLLALLGIGFLAWLLWQLSRDPVRSGPPQITGGVSDDTIRDQLQRRGSQQNFTLIPGSITRGRGFGRMMVSYHGGAEHLRTLRGETMYRARVRYHDGREEDVYMLQGCGNDVTYGGAMYRVLNNFRFEPEVEGVGEPVAAPEPGPVVETPPAALVSAESGDMLDDPDSIKIELKGPGGDLGTAMVRITGAPVEGMTVEMTPRSFTMRWVPDVD